jgi:nucleoside-diphosphate-sugar epimerase
MKVLVTGASGYIGQHLITNLLQKKIDIIASASSEKSLDKFKWKNDVKYVSLDIFNYDNSLNLFKHFDFPDKVIHLAWRGLPNYNDKFHFENNLPKDVQFLTNLITNGVKDITVAGTCFEYGLQEGSLLEEMETYPCTYYGLAKDSLRKYLELLSLQHKFKLKWLRLFYSYGDGQSEKSILSLLKMAIQNKHTSFEMSGGEQIRDYLPIEIMTQKIIDISLKSDYAGILNICSGNPKKLKDFIFEYLQDQSIELKFGVFPYNKYEPMQFWGDTEKFKNVLNNL